MSFYSNGLRFHCTRCSRCCRHDPGYVLLSDDDLGRLSDGLGLSRAEVVDRFCRTVSIGPFKRLSLTEQTNFDCVFWRDGACAVYGFRPYQCSSYPFWPSNMMDRRTWDATAEECPGINIGRLHTAAEIDEILERRYRNPPISE